MADRRATGVGVGLLYAGERVRVDGRYGVVVEVVLSDDLTDVDGYLIDMCDGSQPVVVSPDRIELPRERLRTRLAVWLGAVGLVGASLLAAAPVGWLPAAFVVVVAVLAAAVWYEVRAYRLLTGVDRG